MRLDILSSFVQALLAPFISSIGETWKVWLTRKFYGDWISAIPVFYGSEAGWHIQYVVYENHPFGPRFKTVDEEDNHQWVFHGRLIDNSYLAGTWESLREGSISSGFMSLQISSDGLYMCGLDYGNLNNDAKAHSGVMLLARNEEELENAWIAMKRGYRELLPLSQTWDFSNNNKKSLPAINLSEL